MNESIKTLATVTVLGLAVATTEAADTNIEKYLNLHQQENLIENNQLNMRLADQEALSPSLSFNQTSIDALTQLQDYIKDK